MGTSTRAGRSIITCFGTNRWSRAARGRKLRTRGHCRGKRLNRARAPLDHDGGNRNDDDVARTTRRGIGDRRLRLGGCQAAASYRRAKDRSGGEKGQGRRSRQEGRGRSRQGAGSRRSQIHRRPEGQGQDGDAADGRDSAAERTPTAGKEVSISIVWKNGGRGPPFSWRARSERYERYGIIASSGEMAEWSKALDSKSS